MAQTGNELFYDPEKPGHYEVWYLTFNDPATREGFWLRYTITAGKNKDDSVAEVWGIVFDPEDSRKNLAIKESYPISALEYEKDEFYLKIGDSYITSSGAMGKVKSNSSEISWELCYNPSRETYFHFPKKLYNMKPMSSMVCSPNLDVEMYGHVSVNGRKFELKGAHGGQSHIWGRKHADSWAWAHISGFDGSPDTVFEGLSTRLSALGVDGPPLTSICLRMKDQEYKFNRVRDLVATRSNFELGIWEFSAKKADVLLRGVITVDPQDIIGVTYSDPDGSKSYCYNSEIGNASIDLFKKHPDGKWELEESLRSTQKAAAEFAFRRPARGMELSL